VILGVKVKDIVSGFVGTAVASHHYRNGCVRITVQPDVDKDGKLPDSATFDEPDLEIIGEPLKAGDNSTGGPEKYPDKRRF
jgi:hypothetical protein